MDHGLGLEFVERFGEELVIRHVTDQKINFLAGVLVPCAKPVRERLNGRESLHAELEIPLAADEVVNDGDRMSLFREV